MSETYYLLAAISYGIFIVQFILSWFGGEGDWRHLVLDSIDHWWIKYIRFQRLSNGQYFCFTDSADTIIPLYKDKLKAEFVNQDENHKVHGR